MKVTDYKFQKVTELDFAFSTLDAPEVLVKEAKKQGYYNGNTPANDLFNKWFFGRLEKTPEFQEDVDKQWAQDAMNWAVCFMRSFNPKHEVKEAVCALIFANALKI